MRAGGGRVDGWVSLRVDGGCAGCLGTWSDLVLALVLTCSVSWLRASHSFL